MKKQTAFKPVMRDWVRVRLQQRGNLWLDKL